MGGGLLTSAGPTSLDGAASRTRRRTVLTVVLIDSTRRVEQHDRNSLGGAIDVREQEAPESLRVGQTVPPQRIEASHQEIEDAGRRVGPLCTNSDDGSRSGSAL
jgi:hypothetical protein